jgi:type VI protein secretion system component Hcp
VKLKKAAKRRQQPVALDIFLKVAGIKGESTDDQHREEIDVASFSWGLEAAPIGE